MMSVTIVRGAGLHPAPDISEALLSGSEAAATARADAELDAAGTQRERVSLEIDPRPGLSPNSLAEVREIGRAPWRGLVDAVRVEIAASVDDSGRLALARTLSVEIEREAER